MALNLSTLTNPATSGGILAEALTTADFLDPCPILKNLARGSNKGGDAKQTTAVNQPRALPLIKNPSGNLGGYLYIPNVSNNYAEGPSVTIGSNETWEAEVDMVVTQYGNYVAPLGGGLWSSGFGFIIRSDGFYRVFSKGASTAYANNPIIPLGSPTNIKYGFNGTLLYVDINGQRAVDSGGGQFGAITHPLQLNQQTLLTHQGNYAIQKAKLTVNSAVVFDCDFNGSTSIRHGDQKWKAAVGGVVSIASPELITNGNFDTDTAWTKGAGWTIADGVATLDNTSGSGSSSLTSSVFSVTSGTDYKIVVDVISTSSGFRLYDADGVLSYNLNVGRNVFHKEATSSSYNVTPLGLAGSSGSIDNISVTEVLSDSGRDPITVVKKPVLRFDGADDGLLGLLNQTVAEFHYFIAFSILGSGGETSGRIFEMSSDDGSSSSTTKGVIAGIGNGTDLAYFLNGSWQVAHNGMFDDANGEMLHQLKITNGSQISKINNADEDTRSLSTAISSEEFAIGMHESGATNAAIDLEYLALFPATITDAEADRVRDFINTRNNVFSLIDSQGYYFFDPQKANEGKVVFWNGRIVGSDFGDSDRYLTQTTGNDQPVADGYVVTFADNADHLDIPQVTQAGWQVVGTSLGTFAYRVNANAVTELNLLGNLGSASYRRTGDLYGIILLPESATGADIEAARKLLIDRGAADASTIISAQAAWFRRYDIVEFKNAEFPDALTLGFAFEEATNLSKISTVNAPLCTNFSSAWLNCSALTSFPAGAKLGTAANNVNFSSAWNSSGLTLFNTPLPTATTLTSAWQSCTSLTSFSTELPTATRVDYAWWGDNSLSDFRTTDIKNSTNFISAWQNCSALQSFPAGAKLGTSANNVNFTDAWRSSGLTSFSTPLPTATTLVSTFRYCYSLSSFNLDEIPLATHINTAFQSNAISSFNTKLPKIEFAYAAWYNCSSLTDFSADVFANWNPASIDSGVFDAAWGLCTSLTAQSVENILVSIDASGKYATSDGDPYQNGVNSQLTDAGIDIDYNTVGGTSLLSAATNTAIDSLSGKGWEVYINGVLVIPNILDLAPAAAYSLRSFDANADPNVVKVRRSSDSALRDFKASEVSDGTLRDWTLGNTLALENNRMYFDGVNDKVDVSGVDIGSYSEITIKTRFLWNNGIDANEGIFTNGSTSLNRFGLYVSSQLTFYLGDGSSTFYPSLVSLNENQYYTVVATAKVENGQMTANIFVEGLIDGTENSISTSATDFSVVAQDWVIGHLNVNRYFEGLIDYVDVYEGYSTDGSVTGMTQLHGWSNTNITDASWTDSVGSANGTVSGTPALFSGQGFDGHVTTWYDQGGTNHAAQSDDAKQPKIVDGGTLVTDGGLAAVDFDGTDDSLKYSGDLFGTNTAAMFIVNSFDVATATKRDVIAGGQDTSGTRYDFVIVRQSSSGMQPYIEGSGFSGGISTTDTNQHLYSVTHNSGTSTGSFNRDGVTTATPSSSASVTSATDFVIGTDISSPSDSLNGQIQEIVVFNTDQSANRTGIEKNINDTYTIY